VYSQFSSTILPAFRSIALVHVVARRCKESSCYSSVANDIFNSQDRKRNTNVYHQLRKKLHLHGRNAELGDVDAMPNHAYSSNWSDTVHRGQQYESDDDKHQLRYASDVQVQWKYGDIGSQRHPRQWITDLD